jgi:hypothetical protein
MNKPATVIRAMTLLLSRVNEVNILCPIAFEPLI